MTRITLTPEGTNHCMVCCEDGRRRVIKCLPTDARYIGLKLKVFERIDQSGARMWAAHNWKIGELVLCGGFSHAINEITDVLNTSEKHIAKARGQIEDAGGNMDGLSDLDIAIMDVYVREWLSEQAREVDDPFNPHERSPWTATRTIRLDAPDLAYLFGGYVGEDSNEPVLFD